MSRSGYSDDYDGWQLIKWRGMVASATRGKRGQALLKEVLAALDAMPVKRLVSGELVEPDEIPCSHWGIFETESVCALGAAGKARGIDFKDVDPEDYGRVAGIFDIAEPLAQEIVYMNDEAGHRKETPEARFIRMHKWVASQIHKPWIAKPLPDEMGRWADDGGREIAA